MKMRKFSRYYFYMNRNIWRDFQICISVPLSVRVFIYFIDFCESVADRSIYSRTVMAVFCENSSRLSGQTVFFIKDFFSYCEQMRLKLRIWSNLLKKSLMENFIFCAAKICKLFSQKNPSWMFDRILNTNLNSAEYWKAIKYRTSVQKGLNKCFEDIKKAF